MDWAGRYEDDYPALVDFEDSAEWKIAVKGSVASFEFSKDHPLFGKFVGKLTYRATGDDKQPYVDLRLAEPRPVPADFKAPQLPQMSFLKPLPYPPSSRG